MPRSLSIALIASLCFTLTARADDKPSPAVKRILDKAVAEVKKNLAEFAKENEKPLGDARGELQGLFQKLVDGGKSEDAQAVVKQIETLQADVLRMASGGQKPTLKPAVKTILEKALRDVRRNRDAFDKANQKPLGIAREELQELAKQQAGEGKTTEASATLQQIETLMGDVLAMANAPAPQSPKPGSLPNSRKEPPWPTPGKYRYSQTGGWKATITINGDGTIIYHKGQGHPGTWKPLDEKTIRILFHSGAWLEARKGEDPGTIVVEKTHDHQTGILVPADPAFTN